MSKVYHVEVQLGKKTWSLIKVVTRHTDALHYLKETVTQYDRYPVRIVRVVRTVVFKGN